MTDSAKAFESSRVRGTLPKGTGSTVWFTTDQLGTVRDAIAAVRNGEGDQSIPEGRALELICADYLAGVGFEGE